MEMTGGEIVSKCVVLLELNNVLVCRSTVGELAALRSDGMDGSWRQHPFYIRSEALPLLRELALDGRCILAIVTPMERQTALPIVQMLQVKAGLQSALTLFDISFLQRHEDPALVFDNGKPRNQINVSKLARELETERSLQIDEPKIVLVAAHSNAAPRSQQRHMLVLRPFGLDEVIDRGAATRDLCECASILRSALNCKTSTGFYNVLSSRVRQQLDQAEPSTGYPKPRSLQEQFACPLALCPRLPERNEKATAALLQQQHQGQQHQQQDCERQQHNLAGALQHEQHGPALVLIDLHILVFHGHAELKAVAPDGRDGSSAKRPFCIRAGAPELLKSLSEDKRCQVAIVTKLMGQTAHPIVESLQEKAEIQQELLVLSAASMPHRIPHPDGRQRRQFDVQYICQEIHSVHGMRIDEGRVVLVTSDRNIVLHDQSHHILLLRSVCIDDIISQHTALEELARVHHVLEKVLQTESGHRFYTILGQECRRFRELQQAPLLPKQMHTQPQLRRAQSHVEEWSLQGSWVCAKGIFAEGVTVRSDGQQAGGWAGARSYIPVNVGDCCEVKVSYGGGRCVRVGWAAEGAAEVGTDDLGWGYGSTAMKSHNKKFQPYGSTFSIGDTITCCLDCEAGGALLRFKLNDALVSEDPAFRLPMSSSPDKLFFAVCGTPDFEITVLEGLEAMAPATQQHSQSVQQTHEVLEEPACSELTRSEGTSSLVCVATFQRHSKVMEDALLASELASSARSEGHRNQSSLG